jgi:hypothetical protein
LVYGKPRYLVAVVWRGRQRGRKTIKETLKPGQRGIIFGVKKGETMGHYFNVINENGVIKFLDGQIGKKANLKYDIYKILPTNF